MAATCLRMPNSTAWCLIATQGSPSLPMDRRRDAEAFLASHAGDRGIATYRDQAVGGIRSYIRAGNELMLTGWTAPHPDVTAAALLAGWPREAAQARRFLTDLVATQTGAGVWESYWWRGPLYLSALLLRALEARALALPNSAARRLLIALEREQQPSGGYCLGSDPEDAFSTALALDCLQRLAHVGGERARQRARAALLSQQRDDGGWAGGYVLRIPAPDVKDPNRVSGWRRGTGGGNSFVMDEDGVFATALALYALTPRAAVRKRVVKLGDTIREPESDVIVLGRD